MEKETRKREGLERLEIEKLQRKKVQQLNVMTLKRMLEPLRRLHLKQKHGKGDGNKEASNRIFPTALERPP